ncbi:MAG: hypothetical protein ISR83_01830 [Candidatus Marinimicrobia bacterium]|nr:hypothetical protein [Candidatus Neomarinimicrobiota bacterium]
MKINHILISLLFLSTVGLSQEPYMFPDDQLPPQVEIFPERPPMILELGEKFFKVGEVPYGINPWSGTYWQPSLWLFGNYRTSSQYSATSGTESPSLNNWVNRFDLFTNIKLSGTERFFAAWRPLDKGGMTGVDFTQDTVSFTHNFEEKGDGELFKQWFFPATWFFEGDIAELFQFLDYEDKLPRDIGFTIGRQPIFFQEGIVINDILETFGIAINGLSFPRASNLKISLMAARNHPDRDGQDEHIYGAFTEIDFHKNMLNLDVAYVKENDLGKTNGLVLGGSSVQKFGFWNTSLRVGYSKAMGDSSDIGDGVFLMGEFSRKHYPYGNIVYVNTFIKLDAFTPAAGGGAIGRTGILFAGSGMTGYGSPMGAALGTDEMGASAGYQWFMQGGKQSILFEGSYRQAVIDGSDSRMGVGFKFMKALGQRYAGFIDGFTVIPKEGEPSSGGRIELMVRF